MSKEEVIAELESLLKWLDVGVKGIFLYRVYGMCFWVEQRNPGMIYRGKYLTDVLGLRNPRPAHSFWFHPRDQESRIALVKARIEELKKQQ